MFRRCDSLGCFCEGSAPRDVGEDEAAAESKDDFYEEQEPRKSRVSSLRVVRLSVFDFGSHSILRLVAGCPPVGYYAIHAPSRIEVQPHSTSRRAKRFELGVTTSSLWSRPCRQPVLCFG